jgi:hypothetical protein
MPFTAPTDNPDIRADSDHLPFIAAAGVLFFQPDHIPEIYFQHNGKIPSILFPLRATDEIRARQSLDTDFRRYGVLL